MKLTHIAILALEVALCSVSLALAGGEREATKAQRVACWQVRLLLSHYNGDRTAARLAARARGYSEAEIGEAERRCLLTISAPARRTADH